MADNALTFLSNHHHLPANPDGTNAILSWGDIIGTIIVLIISCGLLTGLSSLFAMITYSFHGFIPINNTIPDKTADTINATANNFRLLTRAYHSIQVGGAFAVLSIGNPWANAPSLNLFGQILLYTLLLTGSILCIHRKYIKDILHNTRLHHPNNAYLTRLKDRSTYYTKHYCYLNNNILYLTCNTSDPVAKQRQVGVFEHERITLFNTLSETQNGTIHLGKATNHAK
jgi:hypothetical protein